ncbi:hypothetical protein [Rhizocola hellebori]|nr:hypothetical protein [Rhizocola hellebori]
MMKVPAPGADHLQTATPLMGITIADDASAVVDGQPLRYQITVHNPTDTDTPITVRVTLSSVTNLQADEATIVSNAVAWKNTLAPGSTRTYTLAGVAQTPTAAPDLAATACIYLTADTPALTCATDLDLIAAPASDRTRTMAWLASIVLGLLSVIGAIWLDRKIRPELLTPDNAAHSYLEQP